MEDEQKPKEEAYVAVLRKVGLSFLAEGTIREEIVPGLIEAEISPESITSVAEQKKAFYAKQENGEMEPVVISKYSGFEYIGEYLGRGIDYRSSIGLLKGRGLKFGYECLYGMVLVYVQGREELQKCYYLLATGRKTDL